MLDVGKMVTIDIPSDEQMTVTAALVQIVLQE
jgi:hypothetical protein